MKPLELGNVWGAEFLWSFHVSAGAMVAGIADLIDVHLDTTGAPDTVLVVDYKTGPGQVPSEEELGNDPQACLELIWARRYFHNAKRVQFQIYNVLLDQRVTIDWSQELEWATLAFVRACWRTWSLKNEKAQTNGTCKWCAYRSDCKGFTKDLQDQAFKSEESLEGKSIDQLMEISHRSKIIEDLAHSRRTDANALIMEKMGTLQKSHQGARFRATKTSRKVVSYPNVSDIAFRLAESTGADARGILDSCASYGEGKKLKTWVNTLPEEKRDIAKTVLEAAKEERSSRPYIIVKETGGAF